MYQYLRLQHCSPCAVIILYVVIFKTSSLVIVITKNPDLSRF